MKKKPVKKIEREIVEEFSLNIPNIFSLLRLLFIFIIIYMLFSGYSKLTIGILFIIAAMTDWFDGYFARKLGQTTYIGARLDQVVDRIFMISIVTALIIYSVINNISIILLLFIVMSREIISCPGFLIRLIRNKDAYQVKYIGKVTTFLQSVVIAMMILNFNYNLILYSSILTGLLGLIAGMDYLKSSIK